jgi:hypothetical protein
MSDENLARQRFFTLSVMRLAGAVIAAIGLLVLAGKLDLPREIGWPFVVVGIAEFLIVPLWLARRWKSPRE